MEFGVALYEDEVCHCSWRVAAGVTMRPISRAIRGSRSLLELLVAIAVIALILGMLMPAFVMALRAALRLGE
jgi:hypothetical protein